MYIFMIFLKRENLYFFYIKEIWNSQTRYKKTFQKCTENPDLADFIYVLLYIFLDFFLPFRAINTHLLRCRSEIDLNGGKWLAVDNNQCIPYVIYSIDLSVYFW